ncbi:hypothetical protein L917_11151 [Phytophthora nicotianae]|uniref:Uncharacterized protein n=1 Tax=Phytophthora nicotianae TaxID=4792 RepID=W2KY25_PHYNI|nr:hypothetical protein L917_11151 [Phytophthora nicotianae]
MFDGKLGIWPLVENYTAQRSSVNRPAGTVLTRNIGSINRDVLKEFLLEKDNAKPHVSPHDPDIVAAGTADGWNIRLFYQPPNSPDLNVLDLGFFSSIQAIQLEIPLYCVDDLIAAVVSAFDVLPHTTLNDVFLTLQCHVVHFTNRRWK